jgi:hypothetical protein
MQGSSVPTQSPQPAIGGYRRTLADGEVEAQRVEPSSDSTSAGPHQWHAGRDSRAQCGFAALRDASRPKVDLKRRRSGSKTDALGPLADDVRVGVSRLQGTRFVRSDTRFHTLDIPVEIERTAA